MYYLLQIEQYLAIYLFNFSIKISTSEDGEVVHSNQEILISSLTVWEESYNVYGDPLECDTTLYW
jgi:hypothetical protein